MGRRRTWLRGEMLAFAILAGCYAGVEQTPDADDADGGTTNGAGGDEVAAACSEDGPSVGASGLRLLTRYEYDNTVRDLLGDDTRPSRAFSPENQTTAFENGTDHRASKDLVRQYLDAAEDVAARAVAERFDDLVPCDPALIGEQECGRVFVEHLLARAFRRPATAEELASFEALLQSSLSQFGLSQAVALLIEATLQSPQFLYRVEFEPNQAAAAEGDVVAVTGYEMASRLSYFLTASMPDDALFEAAANGGLATAQSVEAQARRLLESDGGRRGIQEFHRQWLDLSRLASVSKDPAMYPGLDSSAMGEAWKRSVEQFIEHVVFEEGGTIGDLFASNLAFLPDALVEHYDLGSRDPVTGAYVLRGERAGILTQPGLMALLSLPNQSSPVARGVFIRERLLCQHLPPPPNDAVIKPPDPAPDATTRERFAEHTRNPECAGCHQLIDPLGFGLEHYDAIGRWRDSDNGLPIDASGELAAIDDASVAGPFVGAAELADKLQQSSDLTDCVVHQWMTFALGREPALEDTCSVHEVRSTLAQTEGDLHEMLVAIVTSDAFRYRSARGDPS